MRISILISVWMILVLPPASGALFEFSTVGAADWTFRGQGMEFLGAHDPANTVQLRVRDDAGTLPPLVFNVEFDAAFTLGQWMGYLIGKGPYSTRIYQTSGEFSFSQGGQPLLTCEFFNPSWYLTYIVTGPPAPGHWIMPGVSGAPSHAPATSSPSSGVTYQWFGSNLPAYGLYAGQSVGNEQFRFDYMGMNASGALLIPLSGGGAAVPWVSHAVYSGRAGFIPSPGVSTAIALFGAAAVLRRRRP